MISNILTQVVGSVAPAIATTLGSPLAGLAVNALMSEFGVDGDPNDIATQDTLAKTIESTDPAKRADLLIATQNRMAKEAEAESERHKSELGIAEAEEQTKRDEIGSDDPYVRHTRPMIVRRMFYLVAGSLVIFTGLLALDTFKAIDVDHLLLNAITDLFEEPLLLFSIAVVMYVLGRTGEKIVLAYIGGKK